MTECPCLQVTSSQEDPSKALILSPQGAQLWVWWSAVRDEQKMGQLDLWVWSKVYHSVSLKYIILSVSSISFCQVNYAATCTYKRRGSPKYHVGRVVIGKQQEKANKRKRFFT